MLILPIKKKWFEMIRSGEKKEEYREIKPYYDKRLLKCFEYTDYKTFIVINHYDEKYVIFRNGYSRNSPQIKCLCRLDIGVGKKEWGAEEGKQYYILRIKEICKEN